MSEHVLYQGRMIPKEGFRSYVYGVNGGKKLLNSWTEFENHISTGIWFDTLEKSQEKVLKKKGKI